MAYLSKNWLYEDGCIYILGAAGKDLGTGWETRNIPAAETWRIHKTKFSEKLKSAIKEANGGADGPPADAIKLSAPDAVLLFLETVLTLEALQDAPETGSRILVTIIHSEEELEEHPEFRELQGVMLDIF